MVAAFDALPLLTLVPLAFANTHTRSLSSHHRRQSVPEDLPGNWTSQGCYTDVGPRTLQAANYASGDAMTIESCIAFCESKNFLYAGVEWSQECYCDNVIHNNAASVPLTECNMGCSGNTLQSCGAGGRLNLFWSGATPPPPPATVPSVGNWKSLGCYKEGTTGRALTVGMGVGSPLTIEGCTSACFAAGYGMSGAEFGAEFCGTAIANGGAPAAAADCSMTCAGNSSQFCGGPDRLNVYNYTGTNLPPITVPPPGGGDPGVPVFPETNLPGTWKYKNCYVDNANGRILSVGNPADPALTIQSCIAACSSKGYTVAGTQYTTECYCGNALLNGASIAASGCSMPCGGNSTQACGGANRVSVYSNTTDLTIYPVPTTQTTNLPGSFKYAGCYTETPGAQRVFPYQMLSQTLNATACMSKCAAYGYPASATQFGAEYCGDVEDLALHNSVKAPDADCNIPCSGDPIHVCGGANRLTTYTWDGTPLTTWHKPAVTGSYKFYMPGVVIPLIATVGINNKVTFVEKWGTGYPNSTGSYELDPSLVPDFNKAYREMHVKSDVFCGASLILPDKAGRQLNVGGWSLDSTFGVRLYTPSGTLGVNGTTDWEEDYNVLKLQRGRWYPTAVVMQNSSILIVGGEVGSNGAPEPSLEILPKPAGGPTWLYMDWLERTDPNNLYPFLQILPNGDIFVAYYNEARILDKTTFATKKELPNIPGAVNDDTAGRTYPLEGAAVMLPQHAPYTDYLTFLVCGGSTIGAAIALDNCASIQIDAPNPKWVIERMPSKRVMSCMSALPDGTYLIVNGAHQGVAGFGLATDPNFSAVLYDPYKPVNARMSILSNTDIARMYHSESTLMPDGRVLISGSDSQTYNPDGSAVFPQEFRLEMYTPPYLATGLRQPTFTLPNHDWAYGGSYTITNVKLFQGAISGLRISLLAATSSTHGNTMGQRTIFPKFSCSGTTCTITAPPASAVPPSWHMIFILDGPTPSVAQWIRLGGDPAKLGNWPDHPGFVLPGV